MTSEGRFSIRILALVLVLESILKRQDLAEDEDEPVLDSGGPSGPALPIQSARDGGATSASSVVFSSASLSSRLRRKRPVFVVDVLGLHDFRDTSDLVWIHGRDVARFTTIILEIEKLKWT